VEQNYRKWKIFQKKFSQIFSPEIDHNTDPQDLEVNEKLLEERADAESKREVYAAQLRCLKDELVNTGANPTTLLEFCNHNASVVCTS
jgi:hypothetical protein